MIYRSEQREDVARSTKFRSNFRISTVTGSVAPQRWATRGRDRPAARSAARPPPVAQRLKLAERGLVDQQLAGAPAGISAGEKLGQRQVLSGTSRQ